MSGSELAEDVCGVETAVHAQLSGYDLHGFGEGGQQVGFLSGDLTGLVSEKLGDFHLDGATAGDDAVEAHSSSDNHDRVVERSLGLIHKLLSAASDDDSTGLRVRALSEKVESLVTDLSLFKRTALTQNLVSQVITS